ncbi:hypothetical protein [Thalassotalea fusca]
MKSSNLLISALSVTAVILGATAFSLNKTNIQQNSNYASLSELHRQLNSDIETLKAELSRSQQTLQQNQALVDTLNEEIIRLKSQALLTKNLATPEPQEQVDTTEAAVFEEKSSTEELLRLARRIKNGESVADIQSKIHKRFDEEDIDGSWAYQYEANIRDFVARDENSHFDIQELICKSTVCEMKLTANENNATQLGTLFSKALKGEQWRDENALLSFSSEINDGTITVLIGRDKYSFN